MNIGFDAKRAYHNGTGLGHYSRTLINSLAQYYPENEYYLFNPKPSAKYDIPLKKNIHTLYPESLASKLFPSAWRSSWIKKDLEKNHIEIYHGLSHEIPFGIQNTKIKSVVTIHDLIHERYPDQYSPVDKKIYDKKFRYACANANKIIAISNQTKEDIIHFYKTPEEKITVCYQSCNPIFSHIVDDSEKQRIKAKYDLPDKYFLYVGSIIERKNLLTICKAQLLLKEELDIPLIVIGKGSKYKDEVKEFVAQYALTNKVIFLSEHKNATDPDFASAKDFPAIYQSAIAMIYPSTFEGFGIPVLEALYSKLPVITSNVSCLPEAGGDAALYLDPLNEIEIAEGMKTIFHNHELAQIMKEKGWQYAQNFTPAKCAAAVIEVYNNL